jgi:hypothetical protein
MLGDNPEKSKNPLKKAMRRRNAKTVTFASPTYFEASDIDYSSEEEEEDDGEDAEEEEETGRADPQSTQEDLRDESMLVEPLRPKPHKEKVSGEAEAASEDQQSDRASPEKPRTSDEMLDRQGTDPRFPLILDLLTNSLVRPCCQQIQKRNCAEHGFILQR